VSDQCNWAKIVKLSDHINFKTDKTEYKATWAISADFPVHALDVFSDVLGQLLFDEIREKRGLAYSIRTGRQDFQDVYEYEVSGGISPDATPYIDELVQECIMMVPFRRDLFNRKLRSSEQNCLMVDKSGRGLLESSASDLALDHRIILTQEIWDELQQVTFDQMTEAAALLSTERQYTFIASP
jgi:predicted Zn-dependent peptidase